MGTLFPVLLKLFSGADATKSLVVGEQFVKACLIQVPPLALVRHLTIPCQTKGQKSLQDVLCCVQFTCRSRPSQ